MNSHLRPLLFCLSACLLFTSSVSAFYNPEMGTWLNRDPIGERGGLNLYGMVGGDPVNHLDYLGMKIKGLKVSWDGSQSLGHNFPNEPWFDLPQSKGKLGGFSGFTNAYDETSNFDIFFGIKTKYSAAFVKFESVADWCIPRDRKLPMVRHLLSDFGAYGQVSGGRFKGLPMPGAGNNTDYQWTEERHDGPQGRVISTFDSNPMPMLRKELPTGSDTKVYSFDAPRVAIPRSTPILGVVLGGTWRIIWEDSENSWEAKIRINFTLLTNDPSQFNWSVRYLEQPHEVAK